MGQKKITDLQLRDLVEDDLNFPSDDTIQSYRVTGEQIWNYIKSKYGTATGAQQFLRNISGIPTFSWPKAVQSTKTTTYAISATADHLLLLDAVGGGFTITLPTAASVPGKEYILKKIDATYAVVTIATTSSQTIDGVVGTTLNSKNECLWLFSDGSNWIILKRHIPSDWSLTTLDVDATSSAPTKGDIVRDQVISRRVGDCLEMVVNYVQTVGASNAGSGTYLFALPGGLEMNATLCQGASLTSGVSSDANEDGFYLGSGWVQRASAQGAQVQAIGYDATQYYIEFGNMQDTTGILMSAESGNAMANGSAINFSHNLGISLSLKVPIQGWKAS